MFLSAQTGNNFDAEAAQQLSRALQHLPQLAALFLDDCEIGTEGARHIAGAVKKLTNLRTLSLCTCEITAAGAYVLARCVLCISCAFTSTLSYFVHFAHI